jgi:hypothetical protein
VVEDRTGARKITADRWRRLEGLWVAILYRNFLISFLEVAVM